jgi:hypothetical protein
VSEMSKGRRDAKILTVRNDTVSAEMEWGLPCNLFIKTYYKVSFIVNRLKTKLV